MNDVRNDPTPEQWVAILYDYEMALRLKLRRGCDLRHYRGLEGLAEAVRLVRGRIECSKTEGESDGV